MSRRRASNDEFAQLRRIALSRGRKTYDGKKCPFGHGTTRYVSNNACKTCTAERARP